MRRTCAAAIFLGAMATAWLVAEPATPQAANSQPVVAQGRGQGQGRGGRGGPARPRTRKAVLAWADTRNGIAQHDSTSHALSVIERLGYESGAYDTFIRTDSNIVANQPQMTTGAPASGGPNLTNVDACFSWAIEKSPSSHSSVLISWRSCVTRQRIRRRLTRH
jgi:hypothetical protein